MGLDDASAYVLACPSMGSVLPGPARAAKIRASSAASNTHISTHSQYRSPSHQKMPSVSPNASPPNPKSNSPVSALEIPSASKQECVSTVTI